MIDGGNAARGSWDFFVSYTQADRVWAEWISWQLEAAGYQVLLQAWDFVPGSHWTTGMEFGIADAERTLAILSRAYLQSVYGREEWLAAYRADAQGFIRKLIPIRVEDCERPGLLGGVVSFDLFGCSENAAKQVLLHGIDVALAGRAKPAAEPTFPGAIGSTTILPSETRAVIRHVAPQSANPVFPGGSLPGVFVAERTIARSARFKTELLAIPALPLSIIGVYSLVMKLPIMMSPAGEGDVGSYPTFVSTVTFAVVALLHVMPLIAWLSRRGVLDWIWIVVTCVTAALGGAVAFGLY